MNKILTVVGTRPQFVKAATISRILNAPESCFKEILVHTGQHYDHAMSEIFFKELSIPQPKYNLNVNGSTHAVMTARMMEGLEEIVAKEKPDLVLVYGDTNSTLAGALVAAKMNIPIAHVEAGLRSFNKKMPEEINRILTDHVSKYLFCPTNESVKNLKNEGIKDNVHFVGDVMYDATLYAKQYTASNPDSLNRFNIGLEDFALMTIHRAESTDSLEQLEKLLKYSSAEAEKRGLKIIFPVHPRTKNLIINLKAKFDTIAMIEPVSYFEMHALLSKASIVFTDSGGLQKEAYFHGVECITLRSETEWVETIEAGWNRLWISQDFKSKKEIPDYGDGDAAGQIIKILKMAI